MLLNVLTMHAKILLHCVQLLVGLLDQHDHVMVFMLSPLRNSSLHPELLVGAYALFCSLFFPLGQVYISLKFVDHGEGALEG